MPVVTTKTRALAEGPQSAALDAGQSAAAKSAGKKAATAAAAQNNRGGFEAAEAILAKQQAAHQAEVAAAAAAQQAQDASEHAAAAASRDAVKVAQANMRELKGLEREFAPLLAALAAGGGEIELGLAFHTRHDPYLSHANHYLRVTGEGFRLAEAVFYGSPECGSFQYEARSFYELDPRRLLEGGSPVHPLRGLASLDMGAMRARLQLESRKLDAVAASGELPKDWRESLIGWTSAMEGQSDKVCFRAATLLSEHGGELDSTLVNEVKAQASKTRDAIAAGDTDRIHRETDVLVKLLTKIEPPGLWDRPWDQGS